MTMPVSGLDSRMARAASRPSISGIRISRRATSGRTSSTTRTISLPVDASPTTPMPSAESR
jgi:hypothetical protein